MTKIVSRSKFRLVLGAMLTLGLGFSANADETATQATADAAQTPEPKECYLPAGPIIPDGNVASEDELVAAKKAMNIFQSSLTEFRECLGESSSALDPEADDFGELNTALNVRYNESVDAETNIVAEFNSAVRAFKARQE